MSIPATAQPVSLPFRRPPAVVLTAAALARRHLVLTVAVTAVVTLIAAAVAMWAQAHGLHIAAYVYHGAGVRKGIAAYVYHGGQQGGMTDWG